jgi:ribosomal protein S18 acetylase RimI-like enzyme
LFDALLERHQASDAAIVLGAFIDGTLVGVCVMVRPGRCQPRLLDKIQLVPALLGGGGVALTLRVIKWTSQWSARDPDTGHWHLGPVGVDRALQGRGIGSRLLAEFCARMDAIPSASYLETDKPENVAFYEKFGFQTIGDAAVLGVPNWFMVRTP